VTARVVWLASYPKSGNTWLRAVYSSWRTGGPVDLSHLDAELTTRADFDDALGLPSSSLTADEIELVRPRVDEVLAAEAGGPSLRKIEDAYFRGPAGEPIVSTAATRAAVYVIRDPRDIAVSYAHRAGATLEWAQRRLGDPRAAITPAHDGLAAQLPQRLGTWSEHVRSWVDDAPFPVEVIRYEDCVEEPVATFTRALRFTGLRPVDERRIAQAVKHAAFDRLRQTEEERGFYEPEAPRFFRRGEAGAWRDELPAELAARIEDMRSTVPATASTVQP
jgi:aryl sulfotransferase